MLMLYKQVDKSVLKEGFSIPSNFQKPFLESLGVELRRGETRIITLLLNGRPYRAKLINQAFDERKYPGHSDVLQIRYNVKSPLSEALKETFSFTRQQIEQSIAQGLGSRTEKLPEEQKEYLALYATGMPDTVLAEPILNSEFREESTEIQALGEHAAEGILDGTDETAGIVLRTRVCKVRRLSRSICDDLKKAYDYRCQICGQAIGERYGSPLIHAHHIDYFTRSLNNNASNLLIVCPNHHGVIHDLDPAFDFAEKVYTYPNGYREGLLLNLHL